MKAEKIRHFFTSKGGKSVIIVSALLLVGLAVYLNYRWFYDPLTSIGFGKTNMEDRYDDSQKTSADGKDEVKDYFTATALTREQSRDEAIDVLKLVAENADSTAEAKAKAASEISRIAESIQNESNIESLVKAKGFEQCLAIIGEDSVSVIVKAQSLQANQAAQILSIVCETTGIAPEKVSIITK